VRDIEIYGSKEAGEAMLPTTHRVVQIVKRGLEHGAERHPANRDGYAPPPRQNVSFASSSVSLTS
jgi:hypothetical protein